MEWALGCYKFLPLTKSRGESVHVYTKGIAKHKRVEKLHENTISSTIGSGKRLAVLLSVRDFSLFLTYAFLILENSKKITLFYTK